jgi:hypothetical protein
MLYDAPARLWEGMWGGNGGYGGGENGRYLTPPTHRHSPFRSGHPRAPRAPSAAPPSPPSPLTRPTAHLLWQPEAPRAPPMPPPCNTTPRNMGRHTPSVSSGARCRGRPQAPAAAANALARPSPPSRPPVSRGPARTCSGRPGPSLSSRAQLKPASTCSGCSPWSVCLYVNVVVLLTLNKTVAVAEGVPLIWQKLLWQKLQVRAFACVRVFVCVCACVRACVRACHGAHVHACLCVRA